MLKTLKISFGLHNACRVNGIIYALKSLPLIKGFLPGSLYASKGLKRFANLLSGVGGFLGIFIGKALYLYLVYLAAGAMKAALGDSFAHILLFLTLIGGILNTRMFNPTKDKYYAIILMRMDARAYTLADFGLFLLKSFLGFLTVSLLFSARSGVGLGTALALPLLVLCVKLSLCAYSLKRTGDGAGVKNENKLSAFIWAAVLLLLLGAFLPPALGYALKERAFVFISAAMLLPAGLSLWYILRFTGYRAVYRELLKPENFAAAQVAGSAAGTAQQLALQKKIALDPSQDSRQSGYRYFNELFMKRHAKMLTHAVKRITAVCALLIGAAGALALLFPETGARLNGLMLRFLPYFLFIMYMINRGKNITQAMFMNCDHSMLAYRFYRQPRAVLLLFVERLKYIVLINLMPASVIALGLPLLLYITGGTEQPLNYLILFVSILAMSVFFSVHSIVLYYIFQPYTANLESRSAAYSLINSLTYILCYMAAGRELPTLAFGSAISGFCILYVLAAVLLAYRLAPKTFRLRQ